MFKRFVGWLYHRLYRQDVNIDQLSRNVSAIIREHRQERQQSKLAISND